MILLWYLHERTYVMIMGGLPETISVYSPNDMQHMIRHV